MEDILEARILLVMVLEDLQDPGKCRDYSQ